MRTSLPSSPFFTTSTSPTLNSSSLNGQRNNATSPTPYNGLGMSCFTMLLGTVSNLTALGILCHSRARFRRQSKAPFFQLTVTLLLVDLGGHLIPGAFAMYVHIHNITIKETARFCSIYGAAMVFFGLCPLLLGCTMAIEHCVAITQPFYHVSMITVTRIKRVMVILFSVALVLAYLPYLHVGTYTTQFPKTWCFLPIHNSTSVADTNVRLAFSCLGLTALTLSLLCNILSGVTLLHARIRSSQGYKTATASSARRASSASSSSVFFSLDVEMMMQLAVITLVSCICWGPFLINCLGIKLYQNPRGSEDFKGSFTLLTLRMASWNQILDPWVYILLRKTVLLRVCCNFPIRKHSVIKDYSPADTRREILNLQ